MTLTQVFKYMLEKKDVIKHILYEYIGCNVVEQSFCKWHKLFLKKMCCLRCQIQVLK
jgi:hypothetical protein